MNSTQTRHGHHADKDRWIDRLPPGTVIGIGQLARFRWPIDPAVADHWLVVGCSTHFDDHAYGRWFDALPRTGVTVDARDPRLARLLQRSLTCA